MIQTQSEGGDVSGPQGKDRWGGGSWPERGQSDFASRQLMSVCARLCSARRQGNRQDRVLRVLRDLTLQWTAGDKGTGQVE